ncbi:MAG: STAS-like domain-containing protein [Rhizonema sp. PD37]|nr:STAS-like domain-containing protein [Rhizonema sp. PD37]
MANIPVELDFGEVDIFASPFFNFAIGQLLRDIKSKDLNRLLKV